MDVIKPPRIAVNVIPTMTIVTRISAGRISDTLGARIRP